jgi:CheY-like chemotaxis protein
MTIHAADAPIRVLLAEDDGDARALLTDLLNSMGHQVVAAASGGREAVRRAQEVTPDVVLLDVHMPDGSGIEAAEEITRQAPGTAVVLFSGDESVSLNDREVGATAAMIGLRALLTSCITPAASCPMDASCRSRARRSWSASSSSVRSATIRSRRSASVETTS